MTSFTEHLKILGLSLGASADDIKNAYRKLAKLYHPDNNQNSKSAADMFIKINEAFMHLKDYKHKPIHYNFAVDDSYKGKLQEMYLINKQQSWQEKYHFGSVSV